MIDKNIFNFTLQFKIYGLGCQHFVAVCFWNINCIEIVKLGAKDSGKRQLASLSQQESWYFKYF